MTFIAILLIILTFMMIINCAAVVFIKDVLEDYHERFETIERRINKLKKFHTTETIIFDDDDEEKLKEID